MTAYPPGLLDRLLGASAPAGRPAIEQRMDSIARDLEALLNSRTAFDPQRLAAYPLARASVLNYGLADFAALCLSSSEDRAAICASLKEAIERHEPRLTNVSAALDVAPDRVNRLAFVIHAALRTGAGVSASAETVNFNAVLQPSSLHYAVARSGGRIDK